MGAGVTRILGIDPGGVPGGCAITDERGGIVTAGALPVTGEGVQRVISPALFAGIVEQFRPSLTVIEKVASMPSQGVASMFKFGRGLGIIEGVVAAGLIPVLWVSPRVWKKHFRLSGD